MLNIIPVLCRPQTMDNYAYIITDKATQISAVIDPSEATPVINKCQELNISPKFVINTHHHFDHTDGNEAVAAKFNAKIVCNQADSHRIDNAEIFLTPNNFFELGESKALIIDASAHTQGHILIYFPDDKVLFTGDTLFNLCIGGLFEGTPEQMFEVLSKIKSLPDETSFYPGHEYTLGCAQFAYNYNHGNQDIKSYLTKAQKRLAQNLPVAPVTLGEEKLCNPYLEASSLDEFKRL